MYMYVWKKMSTNTSTNALCDWIHMVWLRNTAFLSFSHFKLIQVLSDKCYQTSVIIYRICFHKQGDQIWQKAVSHETILTRDLD